MKYFTAINHVADDNFIFSAGHCTGRLHHACNTVVNLLERELSTSHLSIIDLAAAHQLSCEPQSYNFRDSSISVSINRKSTRLKKSSSDWSNLVKYDTE